VTDRVPDAAAPRRVVLHVGAPKSGTTYLQRVLWANRDGLLQAGFLVPGRTHRDMFHAAIQVRGTYRQWGMTREALAGTWEGLCAEARAFHGTTVMSHEVLAAATRAQTRAALSELEGLEVHLVFSARDLVRQALSEWQERVKNGSTVSFGSFAVSIRQQAERGGAGGSFWRYQDAQSVFDRWGPELPPSQLHLVVAPRSGASPDELWLRFAAALGLDGRRLPAANLDAPANQTLGVTQTAILRRVNQALDGRIVQPDYARIVKRQFAQKTLAAHTSPRPACPPELFTELRGLSERWVEEIGQRGWQVHGDLSELLPEPAASGGTPAPHPDEVDPASEAALAAAVIADLLVERQQLRTGPGGFGRRSRKRNGDGGRPKAHRPVSVGRSALSGLLSRSRDVLRARSGR
jgi:hypothetical protein